MINILNDKTVKYDLSDELIISFLKINNYILLITKIGISSTFVENYST